MRYEIRLIGAEIERNTVVLHGPWVATDSADDAKRFAEEHAYDGVNGTAIVDNDTKTVDVGNAVLPLSRFTLR